MSDKCTNLMISLIVSICILAIAPLDAHARHFLRKADFTTVVFIGDSLTAGFQNGGLGEDGQNNGYAAQIARQAEFDVILPLISEPGIPPKLKLITLDPLVIDRQTDLGQRINLTEQATNLAVPLHTVSDALNRRPLLPLPEDASAIDAITSVVLGIPGAFQKTPVLLSQVEWARVLEPTFVFVWTGNNDFLGFATSGGTEPMTPVHKFKRDFRKLIKRLERTGADLVVANIPDVSAIAYFFTVEQIAAQVDVDPAQLEDLLGIRSGDLVTLEGLALVEEILAAVETDQRTDGLPGDVVLDAGEVARVQQAVSRANAYISRLTARRNIPLVDIDLLFRLIRIFGIPARGRLLTTNYLGGLFSLDGIHPSNTGYAVVANHFIRTLNFRYKARIPRININQVAEDDPLVIPEILPDIRDIFSELLNSRKSHATVK